MKKNIVMTGIGLLLSANLLFAEPTMEALQWSQGKFEIPVEIQQVTEASELQPFLNNSNTLLRISAVRRLGEIEGPNSISTLMHIFEKEPPTRGIDRVVIVRNEIVRTLGRMESDKAKKALLDILERFWRVGPQVTEARKKYWYEDVDFANIVPETLEQLYKWSNDDNVYEIAQRIALSEDAKKYDSNISKASWKICLKAEISQRKFSEKNSAKYLLGLIADLEEKSVHRLDSLEATKRNAAKTIIEQYSEETLSSLHKDLENDIAKVPYDEPNSSVSKRHYRLRSQMSYIEKVLREKSDSEKQTECRENNVRSDSNSK